MKPEVVANSAADVAEQPPESIGSSEIRFSSASDLAAALRRARTAHGARERRMFEEASSPDVSWPDWYAAYISAEQAGAELPQ
jgi:Uma2 family endonuclease